MWTEQFLDDIKRVLLDEYGGHGTRRNGKGRAYIDVSQDRIFLEIERQRNADIEIHVVDLKYNTTIYSNEIHDWDILFLAGIVDDNPIDKKIRIPKGNSTSRKFSFAEKIAIEVVKAIGEVIGR